MTEFFIHSDFHCRCKVNDTIQRSLFIYHLNTNMNRKFIFKLKLKFKNLIKKESYEYTKKLPFGCVCVHLCNIVVFFLSLLLMSNYVYDQVSA